MVREALWQIVVFSFGMCLVIHGTEFWVIASTTAMPIDCGRALSTVLAAYRASEML